MRRERMLTELTLAKSSSEKSGLKAPFFQFDKIGRREGGFS
jgi:hypothetical protein